MNPANEPRRQFSITLDGYAAEMLHRACLRVHPHGEELKHDQRWLIKWAVTAVCRAIVKENWEWENFTHGLACELRSETTLEMCERIKGKDAAANLAALAKWHHPGRGQLGPIGPDFEWGGAE